MPQYLSPGVYVEEVPSAIKPIAGVSTSTAGFIGIVPDKIQLLTKDPDAATPGTTKFVDFTLPTPAKTPKLITSWTQFAKAFGDLIGDEKLPATVVPKAAESADSKPADPKAADSKPADPKAVDEMGKLFVEVFDNG